MTFTKIKAQSSLEQFYEVIIDPTCINHVSQSVRGQAGSSIIVLAARPLAEAGGRLIPAVEKLSDLQARFPHLTPVTLYSTAHGKVTGPGLVNLGNVVEIDDPLNKNFVLLYFSDGSKIVVDEMPIAI
jgi:hypothetical protein